MTQVSYVPRLGPPNVQIYCLFRELRSSLSSDAVMLRFSESCVFDFWCQELCFYSFLFILIFILFFSSKLIIFLFQKHFLLNLFATFFLFFFGNNFDFKSFSFLLKNFLLIFVKFFLRCAESFAESFVSFFRKFSFLFFVY